MPNISFNFLEAGSGDCIHIRFYEENLMYRNILIDSGDSSTYYNDSTNEYGDLFILKELLETRQEKIDLLILTHIDNDHINGLIKWIEMDGDLHQFVNKVWYNSPRNFGLNDLKVNLNYQCCETGVKEAISFEEYLIQNDLWSQEVILRGDIKFFNNLKFYFLTPTISVLESYKRIFPKDYLDNLTTETGSNINYWPLDVNCIIVDKKLYKEYNDTSIKNKTSLSFVLEYDDLKYLFTGDIHWKDLNEGLKKMFSGVIDLEFFKISHHGSKNNFDESTMSLVSTRRFLFSTDGTTNGHPNKIVVAKILKCVPEAKLEFNYNYLSSIILSENDRKEYPLSETLYIKKDF